MDASLTNGRLCNILSVNSDRDEAQAIRRVGEDGRDTCPPLDLPVYTFKSIGGAQALSAVRKPSLGELATTGIDNNDVVRLGCPIDAHEPVRLIFVHDNHLRYVRVTAVPADPCTGTDGANFPRGIHHGLQPGHGAPQVFRTQGRWVAPGGLARSDQPTTKPVESR